MWSALDSHYKYYAHFWPQPFEWDCSRQKFIAHGKSTKFLPHFLSMVILGFSPLTCVTLFTAQSLGFCKLRLLEELVTIALLLLVTLTFVAEWAFSKHGDDLKFYINYLKRRDAQIQSGEFKRRHVYWFCCIFNCEGSFRSGTMQPRDG